MNTGKSMSVDGNTQEMALPRDEKNVILSSREGRMQAEKEDAVLEGLRLKEAQQEYVLKRRMGGSPNNFQELKDIIRKKKNQRTSKEAQRAKFINRFGIKLSRSDFIGVLVLCIEIRNFTKKVL